MFPALPAPQSKPDEEEEALPSAEVVLDKVGKWRYDNLMSAGYTETQALMLALDRAKVDLHEAVDLAQRAGPTLAYQIVS